MICISLLVWVYLEKNKDTIAGTLLSIATLAKISPGLLGIFFIVQKKYKAVAATVIATMIICGVTYFVFGTKVWHDFIFYHLSNVQTGRALAFLADSSDSIKFNQAPFGIPFKLSALGIFDIGWKEARWVGNIYTVFLFIITSFAAIRKGSPQFRLTIWISVMMFASLRSPFAAPFVLLTVSFLLLLLVCELRSIRSIFLFIVVFILFSLQFPIANTKIAIGYSLVRVILLYTFLLWILFRRERPFGFSRV